MINLFTSLTSSTQKFNCQVYIDPTVLYTELFTEWEELSYARGWQCLIDSANTDLPALASIDNILSLLSDLNRLIDDLGTDLSLLEQLVPYLNMTLVGAVRQDPGKSSRNEHYSCLIST